MDGDLLTPREAARRIGLAVTTLYDWLGRSRRGLLVIHGQQVTIRFSQTGPRAQGRIRISADEIERLLELLRVPEQPVPTRHTPVRRDSFPGITVPLGRPKTR
jgi:hypothetical protein